MTASHPVAEERNGKLRRSLAGYAVDVELSHIGARRDNPACDTRGYLVSRDIFAVVDVVKEKTMIVCSVGGEGL